MFTGMLYSIIKKNFPRTATLAGDFLRRQIQMAWLIISQDVSRADLSSLVFRSNGILFVKCFTWSI